MSGLRQPRRIGLIGHSLGTSLSPSLHTAEAHALGMGPYSYERIDLEGAGDVDLLDLLARKTAEGFTGFNVTYPYKQAVIPCLDGLAPEAAALGAVNTIVVGPEGLIGHNTDYTGFRDGLARSLAPETPRERVTLFGAGGAGSAVAAALLDSGVRHLEIADPDPTRRAQLVALMRAAYPPQTGASVAGCPPEEAEGRVRASHGVVNATPRGMTGIGGTPFETRWLDPSQWVADVVYRPVLTPLLRDAEALGCQTVPGTAMLIEQAADSFALTTGVAPDRERMRAELARLLATGQLPW